MDQIRLSVKNRRLLDHTTVPISITRILYNNLFRCRIRKLSIFEECCESKILGKLHTGHKVLKWHQCMRLLAKVCVLGLITLPWIIRVLMYYDSEAEIYHARTVAAGKLGLSLPWKYSLVKYFTPLHTFFICIYGLLIVDVLVFGSLTDAMRDKFKYVMRQCLRNMRERSKLAVLKWVINLLLKPFQTIGLLALFIYPIYFVIVLLFALPIAAFYIFPTLNLSSRLMIQFFIFIVGLFRSDDNKDTPPGCCSRTWSSVKKILYLDELTAGEQFVKKSEYTLGGLVLQVFVVTICLISFWSVTLLTGEFCTFFVEVFVYLFIGVIVNASYTVKFITLFVLLYLYGKSTFFRVHLIYQDYHKTVQNELINMNLEEINKIARIDASSQENTAFRVEGDMASPCKDIVPKLKIKEKDVLWQTNSMLVFLDRYDTPYSPEKFFTETIDLQFYQCPGPIYRNIAKAMWDFGQIVLFLMFIFLIVMAFGDVYKVSTTNQLLATVAGGFVPLLFRYFFTSSSSVDSVDTSNLQFKTEFHKKINEYTQSWHVFDIIPMDGGVTEWHNLPQHHSQSDFHMVNENENKRKSKNSDIDISETPLLEKDPLSNNENEGIQSPELTELCKSVDIIVDISGNHHQSNHSKDAQDGSDSRKGKFTHVIQETTIV